jgi:hypothetical protein
MHLPLFFRPFSVVFCPLFCQVLLLLPPISVPVLSVLSNILHGISLQTQPGRCWWSIFFLCTVPTCSLPAPPPATFAPEEPVIFENMTQGSRDRSALEDSCRHRLGGLQLGTLLAALAGMTWIKNMLDQLSQLMWAKVAVGPTFTLWQLVLDFGVLQMFVFRVDEQLVHF